MTSAFGKTLQQMLKVLKFGKHCQFPSSGLINPAVFAETGKPLTF
jgi:hypothetical protein